MNDIMLTIMGIIAATITSAAGTPQVIKSWKTKSTKDLSLLFLSQFLFGVVLWTIYGIIKSDIAIIYAQILSYICFGSLLTLKLKYK